MKPIISLVFTLAIIGCSTNSPSQETIDQWKQEIIDAEKRFSDLSAEKGEYEAFLAFASDDAVLKRRSDIIKGREDMTKWLEEHVSSGNTTLTWKPDFVDVSNSGDLGYTYGKYSFLYYDSLGVQQESIGIFHTVWKRQKNGEWKFVYD